MAFTIRNISQLAGVSTATVSRVLNGKYEKVSEATCRRILAIAHENGYRPNGIAKGLVTGHTRTIGLILPDITNPFFPEMARGVEDGAIAAGYSAFLCNTDDRPEKEQRYIRILEERQIDGIVFAAGAIGPDRRIRELLRQNVAVVCIDRSGAEPEGGVYFDNRAGGRMAAAHLLALGHRRIGCITGPERLPNDWERVAGFRETLCAGGIRLEDICTVPADYTIESGAEAAEVLLRRKEVTAVFATNDLMAIGVYEAARKKRLSIPQDISVVGFDDIAVARYLSPGLTTVRQPAYSMGCRAAQMLIAVIEKGSAPGSVVFPPELSVRESTGRLDG